jgi:cyclic pyranopterin phosphate synthase
VFERTWFCPVNNYGKQYLFGMTIKTPHHPPLVDQFSRTISYLRLSITDRCNLRCMYCIPKGEEDTAKHTKTGEILPHSELLSYEEMLRIVRIAVEMGMNKLRLTGGEPLVRRGILNFIHELFSIEGLEEVRLTTNGVLLPDYAEQLYSEGVRHLNISLDSLQPDKFFEITGRDDFNKVWQGLLKARDIGFRVKINVVAMKGINDDEFIDFAQLALREPFQVRFIEFMPLGEKSSWNKEQFINADEIKAVIAGVGHLTPFKSEYDEGPARVYALEDPHGRKGSVGFISPISHHFCDKCNRLRLTSEGRLRACLLNDKETDLKSLLRNGVSDQRIRQSIRQTIIDKPKGHTLQSDFGETGRPTCLGQMSQIGG